MAGTACSKKVWACAQGMVCSLSAEISGVLISWKGVSRATWYLGGKAHTQWWLRNNQKLYSRKLGIAQWAQISPMPAFRWLRCPGWDLNKLVQRSCSPFSQSLSLRSINRPIVMTVKFHSVLSVPSTLARCGPQAFHATSTNNASSFMIALPSSFVPFTTLSPCFADFCNCNLSFAKIFTLWLRLLFTWVCKVSQELRCMSPTILIGPLAWRNICSDSAWPQVQASGHGSSMIAPCQLIKLLKWCCIKNCYRVFAH